MVGFLNWLLYCTNVLDMRNPKSQSRVVLVGSAKDGLPTSNEMARVYKPFRVYVFLCVPNILQERQGE